MKRTRHRLKLFAVIACLIVAGLQPFAVHADEPYEYIVTPGYNPVLYSTNTCSIVASSGSSLTTGTSSLPAAEPSGFDARFRTWLESLGTRLKSTEFRSFIIIVE